MDSRRPSYKGGFWTNVFREHLAIINFFFNLAYLAWSLILSVGPLSSINPYQNQQMFIGNVFVLMVCFVATVEALRQGIAFAQISCLFTALVTLVRVVNYFTYTDKNDWIAKCTNSLGDDVLYPFGFCGQITVDRLRHTDPNTWCQKAWNYNSWVAIAALLISVVFAVVHSLVTFAYHRQTLITQTNTVTDSVVTFTNHHTLRYSSER